MPSVSGWSCGAGGPRDAVRCEGRTRRERRAVGSGPAGAGRNRRNGALRASGPAGHAGKASEAVPGVAGCGPHERRARTESDPSARQDAQRQGANVKTKRALTCGLLCLEGRGRPFVAGRKRGGRERVLADISRSCCTSFYIPEYKRRCDKEKDFQKGKPSRLHPSRGWRGLRVCSR